MATASDFAALEDALDDQAGETVAISGSSRCAKRSKLFHKPDCGKIKSDEQTLKRRDARSVGFRPAPCLQSEEGDD